MPNVWTHFIWGEEVLQRLQLTEKILSDEIRYNLFRFGSQGPDLLFYHRFYPWMKGKAAYANRLGSLMHKTRCGTFLRALLLRCEGAQPNDPLSVYALGFLAHHVLDRNAHPFVFARQGARSRDHQRLEIALDTIIAQKMLHLDTRITPVAPYLDCGPALPSAVAEALSDAVQQTYPESASGAEPRLWHESYRDMLAAMRLFHDPHGVKHLLTAGAIEPFVPGRRGESLDAANEQRQRWRHPAANEKTSQDTFWDVWNRSFADGERVISAAAAWIEASAASAASATSATSAPDFARTQSAWEEFTAALGDFSYETGLACET